MIEPDVKQCCALLYGSEAARFLLGESFHPGGVELTLELASKLGVHAGSLVLDVASGKGTSAFAIAERHSCAVIGIDLSASNVAEANAEAVKRGLAPRVRFEVADAERLPFADASVDTILCECAFCTFPDKKTAAAEFARVLRPGGRYGMSDLTRVAQPLPELDGLLAWVACIGDAQPLHRYAQWLLDAGLTVDELAPRDACLSDMVAKVRSKIFLAEVLIGLGKLTLPGFDLATAKAFATAANQAIERRELGYALLVAHAPPA